jgi:hypothetical protein
LQTESTAAGLTEFLRPEDGAWDPFNPRDFYFLTQDEESSGIIDASDILGEGWFLLDVQAHYSLAGELVEGGQLLALHYPPGRK